MAFEVRGEVAEIWKRSRDYAAESREPPTGRRDGFVYGLVQPFLGVRLLLRHRELLRDSLIPVAWVTLLCLVWAWFDSHTWREGFRNLYLSFAALASLPTILFPRHYARIAAAAHERLGFGPCAPKLLGLSRAVREFFQQLVLVWLVSAPLLFALGFLPSIISRVAAALVGLAWQLHWSVVTVLGEARVLEQGETLAEADAKDRSARAAWFVRALDRVARAIPILKGGLLWFARWCDRLSLPMREELAVAEAHPAIAGGFAVSSALLLALPGVNLFLRPVTLMAASHVLGQLDRVAAAHAEPNIVDALRVP